MLTLSGWFLQNSNILQVDTALFWLMIGINDLNYHMDPMETSQRIYEIARYILASQKHAKISILGILPACYRGDLTVYGRCFFPHLNSSEQSPFFYFFLLLKRDALKVCSLFLDPYHQVIILKKQTYRSVSPMVV